MRPAGPWQGGHAAHLLEKVGNPCPIGSGLLSVEFILLLRCEGCFLPQEDDAPSDGTPHSASRWSNHDNAGGQAPHLGPGPLIVKQM